MSSKSMTITKIVFYKHGVGFFERKGKISGQKNLKLSFKKKDMNDILKSLIVLDKTGKVISVSYDTQEDVEQIIREKSINLGKERSLRDLLTALRGCDISLYVKGEKISGTVVGIDYSEVRENFSDNLLSIYISHDKKVSTFSLADVTDFDIKDEQASADLSFFLEKSIAERKKDEKFVTVVLEGEEHDLQINYVASAPTWRVSYRLIYEKEEKKCILMGWGIVNNTLEEDLENVKIVLTTGMPISFIYDLYTPKMLERPEIKDEIRAPAKPVVFEKSYKHPQRMMMAGMAPPCPAPEAMMDYCMEADEETDFSKISSGTEIAATGEKEGQFFKYNISSPVTIKRGQSAMVPILSVEFGCEKEHVYTSKKGEKNPHITLGFKNDSSYILERGPVTVVEDSSYVGDAIIPFVSKEQNIRLPYAVDVEVEVKEETKNYDHFNSLVFVQNSPGNYIFYREVYNTIQTFYNINNVSDEEVNLVIEHKYQTGYELFETPEPMEKTDNYLRWKIPVSPKSSYVFKVQERTKLNRYEYYSNLTMKTLATWLSNRFLDDNTYKRLENITGLFDEIKIIENDINKIIQEKKQIGENQKSMREQLMALGDRGDEGALRKRYVKNMEIQEDRKEQIDTETIKKRELIEELYGKINKAINALANSN